MDVDTQNKNPSRLSRMPGVWRGEHKQFLAHVYRFDVGAVSEDGTSPFSLVASKGVIVRALAQDLGATLMGLRRTRVGKFDVADAMPFEKLLETEIGDFASCVKPMSAFLR